MQAKRIICWLLGSTACIAAPCAAVAQQAEPQREQNPDEIIVYGFLPDGSVSGVRRQDDIGQADIAAYGLNSVGELIEEVTGSIGGAGEEPVVLINGRPVANLADIGDLPTEAIARVQVLPRQAAAALGQPPGRRVLNFVMKNSLQQATFNAAGTLATQGKGSAWLGEASLLRQRGGNRTSLLLRAKRTDPLFESDRRIPALDPSPFGVTGNILPFPAGASEIDPLLSARAGRIVSIAAVPVGRERPTLTDFAATAGIADPDNAARLRTLIDLRESVEGNANVTRKLGAETVLSVTTRIEAERSEGANGPAGVTLRIPAGSPFTPFSRDVLLARGVGGLASLSETISAQLGLSLTSRIGKWRLSALGTLLHTNARRTIDTGVDASALQAAILAGTRNPFAAIAPDVAPLLQTRSRAVSDLAQFQAIATGPLAQLPAGPLLATIRAGARLDRFNARAADQVGTRQSRLARDELNLFGNLAVPLFASPGLGAVDLQANLGVRDISVIGTVAEYGGSTTWRPDSATEISLAYNVQRIAPSAGLLTEPVVVTPNYRVYDFIRGESALVELVTGGNPDLRTGQRDTLTASARTSPFAKLNLTLSAEFNHVRSRDLVGVLPPVNGEVQAAFPDRFQRGANGQLLRVDNRAVNFARETRDELRWGFDFRHSLRGGATGTEDGSGTSLQAAARGVRLYARLYHNWTLRSDRTARAGLAVIDLLDGGAIGYGSGVAQHSVDGATGVLMNGTGLQISGDWRSASSVRGGTPAAPANLYFASFGTLDLRVFTNLAAALPRSRWARGARIMLEVTNLLDTRQQVRDDSGLRPARYHPDLLDPWGRTVRLTLRKIF